MHSDRTYHEVDLVCESVHGVSRVTSCTYEYLESHFLARTNGAEAVLVVVLVHTLLQQCFERNIFLGLNEAIDIYYTDHLHVAICAIYMCYLHPCHHASTLDQL